MKKTNEADMEFDLGRDNLSALLGDTPALDSACLHPDRIVALVEQEVPESEAATMMEHVALCGRCRKEYAETVELAQLAAEVRTLEAARGSVDHASSQAEVKAGGLSPEIGGDLPGTENRPRTSFWQKWFSPGFPFAFGAVAAAACLF